jgi:hypothetical protein
MLAKTVLGLIMMDPSGLLLRKVCVCLQIMSNLHASYIWIGPKAIADAIRDNGAMTVLNLASNKLGELVLPEGWTKTGGGFSGPIVFKHADGREQKEDPGSKPEGIIAIANAIPDMGAMTSLNLASNRLRAEGAKIVAEAIKVTKCTPVVILAPFSCPTDFSINCCCLLLSAGYGGPIGAESCVKHTLCGGYRASGRGPQGQPNYD